MSADQPTKGPWHPGVGTQLVFGADEQLVGSFVRTADRDLVIGLRSECETLRDELNAFADRVRGKVLDFRDTQPEDGETWESWYYASFDMLAAAIRELQSEP